MVSNIKIQIEFIILSQKNLEVTGDLEQLLSLDVTDSRAIFCMQIWSGPKPKLLSVHFLA